VTAPAWSPICSAKETVVFETMSLALVSEKSGLSFGQYHTGRRLLAPGEVCTLSESCQIFFLADKLRYFVDRGFLVR
jgi:type IV secretion system protein VirD4